MNNKAKIEVSNEYLYVLYKAKNTLWHFINQLEKRSFDYNAVKFKDEKGIYVWLETVKYENNFFSGILPENNGKKNVSADGVIDWMLVEKGRLIGGYTIRFYRDSLSDEEKINFDIDFGLRIDNGNDFFKPDLSTPEGALISLENFYTEHSLEGALSCKDFYKEAINVLLETGKDVEEKLIQETAELLKLAFIENLQDNGMPNFKNVERVFNRIIYNKEEKKQLIEEKLIYDNGEEQINKFWISENEEKKWKILDLVE
ncbi:DUF2314 domain-containing protein [Chryseobacterium mulctrae]|uniref:DUF2314 domain-containing protein n=1 Tax=Chryseobacterium mulctrae TaxID=2576777 RepID=UPI001115CAD0|nr:DUF2314 domain-containing protein [Chryseobacterium mulctrae]